MRSGRSRKTKGFTSNKVRLIRGGKEYFSCLLEMIDGAVDNIHLQTYIFDDDETGQLVGAALKRAAQRNVQVYVLSDGYASRLLSQRFINDLRSAGIQFRLFEPLFKSSQFYFGRRLHHKILVVDTRFCLVGGINIADRYNDTPACAAWLDFALLVEGEAAKELCILCWKTWNGYPPSMEHTPCEKAKISYEIPAGEGIDVRVRRNDWVRRKNEISSTYVNIFRNAQSRVTILCSYFLPGKMIRKQLMEAAQRGVKIKVITAGVSDVWIAKYAERHIYRWLLQHNVEIYEYLPNVLHGKLAICDGRWMTLGSYNINNLSAYASIELNLEIKDEAFAERCENLIFSISEQDCIRVTREYHDQNLTIFKRFTRWVSYNFIHLFLYLSTFYYKHKA